MTEKTIKTGSVVKLKADSGGQRTIQMTVVGTVSKPIGIFSEKDKWFQCRWQWDGKFHQDTFNELELELVK